ncbi:ATP-grasp domain-containing protein [Pseudomonas sp. LRF_L74]|uniref:ATP-grasp domain-containing protein n=1 Tax=Pseudomonas sp. LRF_L74 TaxID=3369422 RepID=UPI003F614B1B
MHVLILGARAPACLEWARAFHGAGWTVTVADSLAWPLARSSRSTDHFLRLPEPREDANAWVDALIAAVTARGIDLILPTCEEVFYLAHGLPRLNALCRVLTSPFELLHRLHHKGDFAAMTEGWEVAAPQTHVITTPDELRPWQRQSADWVFKPAYSRFASQTLIRPAADRLAAIQPTTSAPWVAQRFVPGREHCSFSLLIDGQLRAHASYHPKYRVGRGSGIHFEVTAPAAIRWFVERFGAETGYSGQVGFDFIEDNEGRFHVLECNPRATSGVHLFDDQGPQLVAAIEQQQAPLLASADARQVSLAMLLFGAPRHGLRRQFWRDFAGARDVVVRDGDLLPLLAQLPGVGEIVGRALSRRCGLLAASTADIEWNGQPL